VIQPPQVTYDPHTQTSYVPKPPGYGTPQVIITNPPHSTPQYIYSTVPQSISYLGDEISKLGTAANKELSHLAREIGISSYSGKQQQNYISQNPAYVPHQNAYVVAQYVIQPPQPQYAQSGVTVPRSQPTIQIFQQRPCVQPPTMEYVVGTSTPPTLVKPAAYTIYNNPEQPPPSFYSVKQPAHPNHEPPHNNGIAANNIPKLTPHNANMSIYADTQPLLVNTSFFWY